MNLIAYHFKFCVCSLTLCSIFEQSNDTNIQKAIDYFMPKLNCFLHDLKNDNYSNENYGNSPEDTAKKFMQEIKKGIYEVENNGGFYETEYLNRKDRELRKHSIKFKKYLAKNVSSDESEDESISDSEN